LKISYILATTIGYGRNVPETDFGKIFCIIFVIFGIPYFAYMISSLSEDINSQITRWKAWRKILNFKYAPQKKKKKFYFMVSEFGKKKYFFYFLATLFIIFKPPKLRSDMKKFQKSELRRLKYFYFIRSLECFFS